MIREKVLEFLENNRGESISGSMIAETLGVSRNAVWKTIKKLQSDGYIINASTNRGYCLCAENDLISEQSIKMHLKTKYIGSNIDVFRTIDSTNTFAKKLAQLNAENGTTVISEEQTAGKGRLGRSFYSPERSGLYVSIILRPTLSLESSTLITSCISVAVAKAIEKVSGLNAKIKWVNDIFINGKKVCGILTEAGIDVESGSLDYAVVGIGINVSTKKFPEILKDKATSLELEAKKTISRSVLCAEILNSIEKELDGIESKDFLSEYVSRSNILGQEITVISGETSYPATAVGIDKDARLIVKTKDGAEKTLNSGEISIRAKEY
ncbi:MAG TPA: biotin--[acetyl-CoA-carboxylase] ligase [Oscillospiraceae bacterium]|nr:biotin--[acetyl-CoA-carboxylase] ligase [Oscillospiraceae bacterium]